MYLINVYFWIKHLFKQCVKQKAKQIQSNAKLSTKQILKTMSKVLKTVFRQQQEKREAEISAEYARLMSAPGAMAGAVEEAIMKKFKIFSRATVWAIRKRVSKRQAEEIAKQESEVKHAS